MIKENTQLNHCCFWHYSAQSGSCFLY